MTPPPWQDAFPVQDAQTAVEALVEGWTELAAVSRAYFNPKTHEPGLTKVLKNYVADEVARRHGLFGIWVAEDIKGVVDLTSGKLTGERRTDIVYGWTLPGQGIQLIFEFKRLGRQKKHRDHYLGDRGLERFVTGYYGADQAVAAMVGVLLDPKTEVVPKIQAALEDPALSATLCIRPVSSGQSCDCPSALFTAAEFDTDHDRPSLGPGVGPIRVSHLFLEFGYPVATIKAKATL